MSKLRIIVTGLIGSIPMAGLTLHYIQYVLGLRDLGHDVLYLEDTGTWYYDPDTDSMVDDIAVPLQILDKTMDFFNLKDNWTFIDHNGIEHGLTGKKFDDYLATADVFINVTGAGIIKDNYLAIPVRIYLDTDPGFIHIRVSNGEKKDIEHLKRHNKYFSFGFNIGKPKCNIPTSGFHWSPTCQPIYLDFWPSVSNQSHNEMFTTILKWQTYSPEEKNGEVYGMKNTEFMKFIDLPSITNSKIELSMSGKPPIQDLTSAGWLIRNARNISKTLPDYRNYIQHSKGEWSIAKNGYVKSYSGWFSDRSASYLASGRPVILQSTGYEEWLDTGLGLISFNTLQEAANALEEINKNYKTHSDAAREMAVEFFDSKKVLSELLKIALSS